jgi:hypothetical protein
MVKKIISTLLATVIVTGACVTTALAADVIDLNKYNTTYSKTSTSNELNYTFKGTSNTVSSSGSNNTGKYSRYISTYVARKSITTGSVIASDSDDTTTTNGGTFSSVSRPSKTDKTVYYYHAASIKPSAATSYVIGSAKLAVSQIPNS